MVLVKPGSLLLFAWLCWRKMGLQKYIHALRSGANVLEYIARLLPPSIVHQVKMMRRARVGAWERSLHRVWDSKDTDTKFWPPPPSHSLFTLLVNGVPVLLWLSCLSVGEQLPLHSLWRSLPDQGVILAALGSCSAESESDCELGRKLLVNVFIFCVTFTLSLHGDSF